MAKTYTSVPNVATGDVYTASTYNTMTAQNMNNHRVPTMCSLYRNAALSHTSTGNYQSVAWDTEHFTQTDSGMWSAGTNPSRITLTTAGVYFVTATLSTGTSASGIRTPAIYKNGAAEAYGDSSPANAVINFLNVAALVQSNGTDYVEVFVYQDSGGNVAYQVNAARMRFSVIWLGQVS